MADRRRTAWRCASPLGLGGTDRFLGFVFGALRGGLVVIGALIVVRPFAETSAWWEESLVRPELLVFEDDILELFRTTGVESTDAESADPGSEDEAFIKT